MNTIRRILIVLRQTQNCLGELYAGIALGKQLGAEIYVLAVFSDHVGVATFSDPEIVIGFNNYLSVHDQFESDMEAALNAQKKLGIQIKEFTLYNESVKDIEQLIVEEKIDLMVLQAHEEGRFEHLLFGGENDTLIRKLPCSIMLLKQEQLAVEPVMPRSENKAVISEACFNG